MYYEQLQGKDALNILGNVEEPGFPEIAPLANLFIVATQAHNTDHGNLNTLESILDNGCDRFYNTLTPKFWSDRTALSNHVYTKEEFRARFFAYTTDIETVKKNFEQELKRIIQQLPRLIEYKSISMAKKYCEEEEAKVNLDIEKYQDMINEREKYSRLLEEEDALKKYLR